MRKGEEICYLSTDCCKMQGRISVIIADIDVRAFSCVQDEGNDGYCK